MKPPVAKTIPSQVEKFGITLTDDYAWLREKENPEVKAYLEAENAYTQHIMGSTKDFQAELYTEMLARIKETDLSVPHRKGNYWYYSRTEEGKAYTIHCRKKGSLDAEEEVILDENVLAEGHDFFDLGDAEISPNEQMLCYTTDISGGEVYTLHFKDLRTGEILAETIEGANYPVEWGNDNLTIFFVTLDEAHRPFKLFRSTLHTGGKKELVFHEPDDSYFLSLGKTNDERYLLLSLDSMVTSEVRFLDANTPQGEFTLIAPREKKIEYNVEHHTGWFYIITNENAVNFKLVKTEVSQPGRAHWKEVIAHDPQVKLSGLEAFAGHLAVHCRKNGLKNIFIMDLATGKNHDIEFPEPVYTVSASANPEFNTEILRFSYASLITPASVFDYNMNSRTRELKKEQPVLGGYDRSLYESKRVLAKAEDGTEIPISMVWRKDLRKPEGNPLFLYAYGSYGHSIDPHFVSYRLSLLDRGVIFAIAHIRGGGEMGRPWYENGKFLYKWNTFNDFIASAEYLISEGYTRKDLLVASGGSAGGLLMGAIINKRPDLFQAVIAHVPFVDVMNTMLDPSIPLTVVEYDEWGNPNEEKFFRYMHSYSPYDNVRKGPYPNLLVTAGLNDPRVHYWEPAKWVSKLRTHKTDQNTLILKTNMGAGHQGRSGRYEYLKEKAFDLAFVFKMLGMTENQ